MMSHPPRIVLAAVAAASLTGPAGAGATPPNEAEIIDERLTRKVTLAIKAE